MVEFLGQLWDWWLIQTGTEMVWMNELKDTERVKWRMEAERQAWMITYLSLSMNLVLRDWEMASGRWKVEGGRLR